MEHLIRLRELTFAYPEGFHVMDEAEWSRLQLIADGEGAGLSDPERHMIVTLGFRQVGGLTSALLSTRDLAKNMEKQIQKPMAAMGYTLGERKQRTVGGKPAEGIRYRYTAQNVDMTGESYVIKDGRSIWYLHVYLRTELLDASLPVWEEMLRAAAF